MPNIYILIIYKYIYIVLGKRLTPQKKNKVDELFKAVAIIFQTKM
jgi:pyrroline-5-carboxylate reductase